MKTTGLALLLLCAPLSFANPPAPQVRLQKEQWNGLVDAYYDAWFALHPSTATSLGLHGHDGELEGCTAEARAHQAEVLKGFLARITEVPPFQLRILDRHDREALISAIQAELLELDTVKGWERDPGYYPNLLSSSVWTLMGRTFAPPEVRLRSVIARERQFPQTLQAAHANLKTPPRIFTEIALAQLPGLLSFFGQDLPGAFQGVKDPALLADFAAANGATLAALKAYQTWLKEDVLPRSTGSFALGADRFAKKLLYEEMVDIPLDRLLEVGLADLRHNQAELKRVAALVDPKAPVREVMARVGQDHPAAGALLQSFQDGLQGARAFIVANKLMTVPQGPVPVVRETPPFMRALTTASMDLTGPFEKTQEAFFHVTLPDPAWSAPVTEDYLRGFSRGMVQNVLVHEAFPGHYVQFLFVNWMPGSKVRKVQGCGTNVEGWAHYTEQLMVEAGFAAEPRQQLAQVQDALLRDARFIVAIKLHTQGMTLDEARAFFVAEGFQQEAIADMEAKRGTADPMYLEYTLGKLEVLKLREDFKKKRGDAFTLKGFHDAFLSHGALPIRLIREEMLDTPGAAL